MQDALAAHAAVEEQTFGDSFAFDEDSFDRAPSTEPAAEGPQADQSCGVGEFEPTRVILEEGQP